MGMAQNPKFYTSRLQQMEEGTDLLDQTHLFLSESVVIICKDEKIDHIILLVSIFSVFKINDKYNNLFIIN